MDLFNQRPAKKNTTTPKNSGTSLKASALWVKFFPKILKLQREGLS